MNCVYRNLFHFCFTQHHNFLGIRVVILQCGLSKATEVQNLDLLRNKHLLAPACETLGLLIEQPVKSSWLSPAASKPF